MSRLGFANIYELLDESDSSGVETGRKAQEALEKKNAAAAAALAPAQPPKPVQQQTGKPAGERRQGGNDARGPRQDRGPRPPRPQGERSPRTDRPPRAEGDRPRRPRPPQSSVEGGEATFTEAGQAAAEGAPRPNIPRGQKGGPRPDRGYERRRTGDQDQRPQKREYDRHSGTGRGKEVSKGGAGKGNWGSIEEEAEGASAQGSAAEVAAIEDVKKEGEEATTEPAAPAEAAEAAEPEPAVRTLDDYLNQRKKVAAALPTMRKAGEGEDSSAIKGFVPFTRTEETLFAVDKVNKDKKKETKESTEKKVSADQVLKFQEKERREREGGDRRGGRGGARGGNQGKRGGNASSFNIGDQSAFPTLSTKA